MMEVNAIPIAIPSMNPKNKAQIKIPILSNHSTFDECGGSRCRNHMSINTLAR